MSPGGKYPFAQISYSPFAITSTFSQICPFSVPCRTSHDTTILLHLLISSYFVVFFLTPTAIALSSLHEGLFSTAHHSPRPNSSELRVPSWYVYFSHPNWLPSLPRQCVVEGLPLLLLPDSWLLPHPQLYNGALPRVLLELIFPSASLTGFAPLNDVLSHCSANIGRPGPLAPSSLLLKTRMLTEFLPDHSHSFLPSFSDLSQFYIHNG